MLSKYLPLSDGFGKEGVTALAGMGCRQCAQSWFRMVASGCCWTVLRPRGSLCSCHIFLIQKNPNLEASKSQGFTGASPVKAKFHTCSGNRKVGDTRLLQFGI